MDSFIEKKSLTRLTCLLSTNMCFSHIQAFISDMCFVMEIPKKNQRRIPLVFEFLLIVISIWFVISIVVLNYEKRKNIISRLTGTYIYTYICEPFCAWYKGYIFTHINIDIFVVSIMTCYEISRYIIYYLFVSENILCMFIWFSYLFFPFCLRY